MEAESKKKYKSDCTCLQLYINSKKAYKFHDCEVLKKCLNDKSLNELKSVCICGKEGVGKTIVATEILADLSSVYVLNGMNLKVLYLDCDLTFNYKNYEQIMKKKFSEYARRRNIQMDGSTNISEQKRLFQNSFSNIYYLPVFNPAHLLLILNTLKNILMKNKTFIQALILDSLSAWNYAMYDQINFFSNQTRACRSVKELLDYAYTLIINLKDEHKFLFFYTKVYTKELTGECTIHISSKPRNEETGNHVFLKKNFKMNDYVVEDPSYIYLFKDKKKKFKNVSDKKNMNHLNYLLCISSDMVDLEMSELYKYVFVIKNSYSIMPLQ